MVTLQIQIYSSLKGYYYLWHVTSLTVLWEGHCVRQQSQTKKVKANTCTGSWLNKNAKHPSCLCSSQIDICPSVWHWFWSTKETPSETHNSVKYQHNDNMHVVFLNQINKIMTVNLLGKHWKTSFLTTSFLASRIPCPNYGRNILSRTGLMFQLRL